MSIQDLRGFISLVEEAGGLRRISVEVDPDQEIAAITDRVCKMQGGGPGLLFEKVKGHKFPVATNLFGSFQRTAWALWSNDFKSLTDRVRRELKQAPSGDGVERLRKLCEAPAHLPRLLARPPCQQVVHRDNPDLGILPALRAWPGERGGYVTLPLVFTRDPATGRGNCGMYRLQILDNKRAAIRMGEGSDAARHYTAWGARGKRMPVAVAIGGDPVLTYAAGAPLPGGIEETSFAGFIRQTPIQVTRCISCDLEVPAAAEFVLEGYVEPGEREAEGPFGNHTGYYRPESPCPVFHVTAITHRSDAIYPCTVVGPPPMEDCYLAKASERLFLPVMQIDHPEIVDINFPLETIYHRCALISIRKESPGQGVALIRSLWKSGLLKGALMVLVVDDDVDVQNPSQTYWRVTNGVQPPGELIAEGGRVGIDATRRWPEEGGDDQREPMTTDPDIADLVKTRWSQYGIGPEER